MSAYVCRGIAITRPNLRSLSPKFRLSFLVLLLSAGSFLPSIWGNEFAQVRAQSVDTTSLKHPATSLDEKLLISINHWGVSNPSLDGPMLFLSNTAAIPVFTIPIGLYVLGRANHDRNMAISGMAIGVGEGVASVFSQLAKAIVQRERPYHTLEDVRSVGGGSEAGFSFPSAHATAVWTVAAGLSWHFPKWYVIAPATIYAAAVSLSRPYLGVHYVTDILAGAIVGIGCSYLIYKYEDRIASWVPGLFPSAKGSSSPTQAAPIHPGYGFSISLGVLPAPGFPK